MESRLNKLGAISAHRNVLLSIVNNNTRNNLILEEDATLVNRLPNQEPFDVTEFATNWTSIISSMVTAIVLSRQLQNN